MALKAVDWLNIVIQGNIDQFQVAPTHASSWNLLKVNLGKFG